MSGDGLWDELARAITASLKDRKWRSTTPRDCADAVLPVVQAHINAAVARRDDYEHLHELYGKVIEQRDAVVARAEAAEQALQRVRAETAEAIAQAIEAEYADSPWIRTAIDIARQHAKGDGDE